jgi:TfoX/Sxy family transcriptional regulator of competence genes
MASKQATADYLAEQLAGAGEIRTRKMFGEYGLYCDEKIVAFICDDQLFVKPTEVAPNFLGEDCLAPAYPGSKNYYRVPEDKWDDAAWLCDFIRQTADVLPAPKPKK